MAPELSGAFFLLCRTGSTARGESPLLNRVEVKSKTNARASSEDGAGKKRGAKARADEQEPDRRPSVLGELADDSEAQFQHERWW
jgi:hypothetical protein